MAKAKQSTVEEKLIALYTLQSIDTEIDKIKILRGELPLEVQDLEDEIAGLQTRVTNINDEIAAFDGSIKEKESLILDSKALMKKYDEQLKNIRNNREFDSLNKEIEFQELEMQLADKHIKEFKVQIEQKKEIISDAKEKLKERTEHLKHKKGELDAILKETEKEEEALIKESTKYQKKIEERLVIAYNRIRNNVKNGLAVVAIERGASGGSFFTIPPQIQVEIAARKKVITDEHSGRILVDALLAEEEKVKMNKLFVKLSK